MSRLRVKRTSPPQQPVGIDWGNPFARGLAFAFSAGSRNYDAVRRQLGSNNGGLYRLTSKGVAYKAARIADGGVDFGLVQPITGGEFTVLALANPASSDGSSALFSQRAGSAPSNQFDLSVNGDASLGNRPGGFVAIGLNADSSNNVRLSDSISLVDGAFHTYGYIRRAASSAIWFDGATVSSTLVGFEGGTIYSSANKTRVGNIGDYSADGVYAASCDIPLVLVWNRALSSEEYVRVVANPWALFAPPSRRIYASAAVGAITLATAATAAAASTASLTLNVPLASSAAAAATATAALNGAITLATAGSATATTTAVLTDGKPLAAAGAATAASTAALNLSLPLAAAPVAVATTTAALSGTSLPTVGHPASDTTTGAWTPSTGTTLYGTINEVVPDGSNYISTTSLSTCEFALNNTAYPGTANQTLSYRASSSTGNGLTAALKQGATVIATWSHALTNTDTLYTQTLTAGQIAAIAAGPLSVSLTST